MAYCSITSLQYFDDTFKKENIFLKSIELYVQTSCIWFCKCFGQSSTTILVDSDFVLWNKTVDALELVHLVLILRANKFSHLGSPSTDKMDR